VEEINVTTIVRAFLVGLFLGAAATALIGVAATGAGRGDSHSQLAESLLKRSADEAGPRPDRALILGLEKRRGDNDRVLRGAVERIQNTIDDNAEPLQQIGATLNAVASFLDCFNNWMDANNDIADSFYNHLK
jgi:hypothetical protein